MGYGRIKAEHAEAKNGGGAWAMGAEAKHSARRKHRQTERPAKVRRTLDGWGDLDRFSAQASGGVLRHLTEEEETAGLSWESVRPE